MRRLAYFLFICLPVLAQDYTIAPLSRRILTNEGVISLAKAGFDEFFIIERIKTSRIRFDASVAGLIAMKEAGVSEDLIRAMAAEDLNARKTVALGGMDQPAAEAAPAAGARPARAVGLAGTSQPAAEAAPAAGVRPMMVMVEKRWWGFRWVRVSR